MRTAAAVVVPWLVWGLLDSSVYAILRTSRPDAFGMAGQPNSPMLLVFLGLRAAYSFAAGWLAGRIAGRRGDVIRIFVTVLFVTGVAAQIVNRDMYPLWYHLAFVASIVPCTAWGAGLGRVGRRRLRS